MNKIKLHINADDEKATLPKLNDSAQAILKTLAYFDVFHYPLTKNELKQFTSGSMTEIEMSQTLDDLLAIKYIYGYEGFYSLQKNPLLIHRRNEGNIRAEKLLVKALKIGRFLYQFPFVRAVGVSGSLSKNFADEKADIDFFIITKANRLWIARTMTHLFKKLTFITGRQHFYCMNYYIDENAFVLDDKNIFTAIELKTLLPVCGEKQLEDFFEANIWANQWLPNCSNRIQQQKDPNNSWLKRSIEWMLNKVGGNRFNNYLWRATSRRWKRKELAGKKNEKGHTMGLITGKHFAKSNPGDFQQKVLTLYQKKANAILETAVISSAIISSAK